ADLLHRVEIAAGLSDLVQLESAGDDWTQLPGCDTSANEVNSSLVAVGLISEIHGITVDRKVLLYHRCQRKWRGLSGENAMNDDVAVRCDRLRQLFQRRAGDWIEYHIDAPAAGDSCRVCADVFLATDDD